MKYLATVLFHLIIHCLLVNHVYAVEHHRLAIKQSQLDIHFMDSVSEIEKIKLIRWIEYGANSLLQAYGEMPHDDLSIYIYPVGPYSEAVPWGEIKREPVTSMHLYVDHKRSLEELINDWTLVHEFSHTMHPYLWRSGRWLSEGLATYYENVLQARIGTITSHQAWTNLHQGFTRGEKEQQIGETLEYASVHLRKMRKYMRVYWSGTAYWLNIDYRLRTEFATTLDTIIKELKTCCLDDEQYWTVERFVSQLDDISNTTLFSSLFNEYHQSDTFPDISNTFAKLGIERRNDEIIINSDAIHHHLIDDITRPIVITE